MDANDGRKVVGWLLVPVFEGVSHPVVQVISGATGKILDTVRVQGGRFQPHVYATGNFTVKCGREKPDGQTFAGLEAKPKDTAGQRKVKF